MTTSRFEFSSGSSNKFWEVWVEGSRVLTRYGKLGAEGQVTVKDEGSPAAAQKLRDKLVREKTAKGYVEKGAASPGKQAAATPTKPKVEKPKAEKAAKTLKWTSVTRRQLHVFRSQNPNDPPEVHAPRSVEDAWQRVVEAASTRQLEAAPPHEATVERLTQEFAAAKPPKFDAGVELFRAAAVLEGLSGERDWASWDDWAPERALVSVWLAQGGVGPTLKLLLQPGTFWVETTTSSSGTTTSSTVRFAATPPTAFAEPPPTWSLRPSMTGGAIIATTHGLWSGLRRAVDLLDDERFAEATAAAHAVRKGLPAEDLWGRWSIAFAFARDSQHATEELERAPAKTTTWDAGLAWQWLLLAVPDAKAALAFIENCSVQDVAFDLVETFGADARALLERGREALAGRGYKGSNLKRIQRPIDAALKLLG